MLSRRAFLAVAALAAVAAGDTPMLARRLLMAARGGSSFLGGPPVSFLSTAYRTRRAETKLGSTPSNGVEQTVLQVVSGGGWINWIWMAIPPVTTGFPGFDLRIRIYTDGSGTPDIDQDLGVFFGYANSPQFAAAGISTEHFQAQGVGSGGTEPTGACRLLIPFSNGVKVALYNGNSAAAGYLFSQIDYTLAADNAGLALLPYRLHTDGVTVASATAGPAAATDNFTLHTIGAGNPGVIVAHSMTAQSTTGAGYLERGVNIAIDGEGSPSILSSGTEDWFTGSFYFVNGPFSRDYAMGFGAMTGTPWVFSALVDVLALNGGIAFSSSAIVTWDKVTTVPDGCSLYADCLFYYRHT